METTPLLRLNNNSNPPSPSRTRQPNRNVSRNFDLDAYLRDAEIDDDDYYDDDPFMATVPLYTLIPPWLVIVAMAILITAFVLAILGSRDPVYTLSPSDCDDGIRELYTNVSSWFLGDWNLLYGRGACPVEASGMKTVYIKQGNDMIAQTFFAWNYCLNNSTQWTHIDEMNAGKGYESHLAQDEWKWTFAFVLSLCAIMTMFFAVFLLGLLLSEVAISPNPTSSTTRMNKRGQINVIGLIVAVLLLTLFFLQEVGVLLLVGHTARRDPKAWSTAFYEGCSVSILRDDGYLHTIIAAALTGVVLLFAATTALLHVYRNHAIVVQIAALTGASMGSNNQQQLLPPNGNRKFVTFQEPPSSSSSSLLLLPPSIPSSSETTSSTTTIIAVKKMPPTSKTLT